MKKLYKSERDQILTGLIGGLGEYFGVDPTVLRIGFVILVLITGIFPGVAAYVIAYFIIPERPHDISTNVTPPPMKTEEKPVAPETKKTMEDSPSIETTEIPAQPITAEESTITVEDLLTPTIQTKPTDDSPLLQKDSQNSDEPMNISSL